MYNFGRTSRRHLMTLHPDLRAVLYEAIKLTDFSVIEGYRNEERQNQLFEQGKSKLRWPNSKHNSNPSRAVDIAPYPIDWDDLEQFALLAGIVIGIGHKMGIPLRWGGDWNRNGSMSDNRFNDLPHIELV